MINVKNNFDENVWREDAIKNLNEKKRKCTNGIIIAALALLLLLAVFTAISITAKPTNFAVKFALNSSLFAITLMITALLLVSYAINDKMRTSIKQLLNNSPSNEELYQFYSNNVVITDHYYIIAQYENYLFIKNNSFLDIKIGDKNIDFIYEEDHVTKEESFSYERIIRNDLNKKEINYEQDGKFYLMLPYTLNNRQL